MADVPGREQMYLNDSWSLRAHDPRSKDWTLGSYTMLCQISNIDDFWIAWNSIRDFVPYTMIFLTREHVFPAWDDPSCIDGCTVSRVFKSNDATAAFLKICQRALGETLSEEWTSANGVSVSPKKGTSVIKAWLSTADPPVSLNFPGSGPDKVELCRSCMSRS